VYEAAETPDRNSDEAKPAELRDAGEVDWKHILRIAAALAVPAGVLIIMLGILGVLLMTAVAAAVVVLYMRNRQPAWLTVGAGARIGLVTGLLSSWTTIATTSIGLFVLRFWLHQGKVYDDLWAILAAQRLPEQLTASGLDAKMIAAQQAKMLSPNGQAGWTLGLLVFLSALLLPFAVAGGVLGARLLVHARKSPYE
jgi:hypothetical protein